MVVNTTRVTISMPTELANEVSRIAREQKIKKSQLISLCIKDIIAREKKKSLIKYYQEMDQEHKVFGEKFIEKLPEITNSWRD
jgi:metal-responsive CopG/Arc/MetJ family transcriptional regulator